MLGFIFADTNFAIFSRGYILADNEMLITLRGLIVAVVRNVVFMSSMIIAGKNKFLQNYQRFTESVYLPIFVVQIVKKQNHFFLTENVC